MLILSVFWISCICGCSCSLSAAESTETSHSATNHNTAISSYETWIFSLLASCLIGFSGIIPLIFIPLEISVGFGKGKGDKKPLHLLLSFAVGGLLGDVFLHLLPEAWHIKKLYEQSHLSIGLWVLFGLFSFVVIEMMFTACHSTNREEIILPKNLASLNTGNNGNTKTLHNADSCKKRCHSESSMKQNGHDSLHTEIKEISPKEVNTIHITGYLNLMANGIDNFTHGLAVAASFLVSCKMGVMTTFAILIHEIPHEIGDFAILMKSGFRPWAAAKAQASTATIGIIGVIVALTVDSIDQVDICTSWILPFTAGGFLHIALVNVLPDLLKENDPWESMKQLVCICAGISVMAIVSLSF